MVELNGSHGVGVSGFVARQQAQPRQVSTRAEHQARSLYEMEQVETQLMVINPSDAQPEKKSVEELEQEIKAAQAEHAAVVAEQEKSKQEFEATVAAYKETNASNAFNEAIRKTGIAWHPTREELRTLLTDPRVGGFQIEFSNDGTHCLVKDSRRATRGLG